MLLFEHHFPLLDMNATGQPKALRVLVPLIEDIEFLRRGRFEIFHSLNHFDDTRAAGAIEATGFHLHAGQFARFQ